ncbi:hypothetical protein AALO_G00279180 [Alosa alosa]|uniref:alpha-N-acetylgalactosaminide alpha-2,6-sialyltransferase n=1 Tax=Alosa alosa TaxID=278164 RepID=A0AAV6FIZ6_9TELE|nr:hypothetical protein AALO_G00279180 [Alosa alosa]
MELPARRLVLFFVVINGFLGLYVLCVSLQIQVPWHMVTDNFRALSDTKDATRSPEVYAAENTSLQTSCPDSIRTKVPLSSFAKKFLETIPVLQWAKYATMAEYQRLKNYPGAHGWGGLQFPLLQSTLSILNTTANRVLLDDWDQRPNRSQCIRCAVVGNGGILKDSKKGLEIDQHDYIFRTNGAVIKGFEQDVGSRTSFYTFSTNTMHNSLHRYQAQGYNGPPLSEAQVSFDISWTA